MAALMNDELFNMLETRVLENVGYSDVNDPNYSGSVLQRKLRYIKKLSSIDDRSPGGLERQQKVDMELTRLSLLTDALLLELKEFKYNVWQKITSELRKNGKVSDQFSSFKFELLIAGSLLKAGILFDKIAGPDFEILDSSVFIECTSCRLKSMDSQVQVFKKIKDTIAGKQYKKAKPILYANSKTALAIDVTNLVYNLKVRGMNLGSIQEFIERERLDVKFGSVVISSFHYLPGYKDGVHQWSRMDQDHIDAKLKSTLDAVFPAHYEVPDGPNTTMNEF